MVLESTRAWLESLALPADATVLANIALGLAKSYDDEGNTSTAAELRKTVLEIKRMVGEVTIEIDPVAELLKR
jgi:hypothetical protein